VRRIRVASLFSLILLALLLAACEGSSTTGSRETAHANAYGGDVTVRYQKANGSVSESIETEGEPDQVLDAFVILTVEKGAFKIELLGKDDEVTLVLEASDGQTVSGEGQMIVDTFSEASYRVTATEAQKFEYRFEYAFRPEAD
jgi:ABC-type oligopeptide transport system substrate-binding subunit